MSVGWSNIGGQTRRYEEQTLRNKLGFVLSLGFVFWLGAKGPVTLRFFLATNKGPPPDTLPDKTVSNTVPVHTSTGAAFLNGGDSASCRNRQSVCCFRFPDHVSVFS
jgi:hypothetical protein